MITEFLRMWSSGKCIIWQAWGDIWLSPWKLRWCIQISSSSRLHNFSSKLTGYQDCCNNDHQVAHHYSDVIMSAMVFQIINLTIVYLTVYSGADHRKHQSSTSLAFERGIHWWPVNSLHKWPVMWKLFPFDDVSWSHNWLTPDIIKHPSKIANDQFIPLEWFLCEAVIASHHK